MHNPRTYHRPQTLQEAVKLAADADIAIAGGAFAFRGLEIPYETIVDLQDIPELKRIARHDHYIQLGGAATLQDVVNEPMVLPALKTSLTRTIPINIRNGASVGETLVVADPPREWLASLLALNTQVQIASKDDLQKEASLEDCIHKLHGRKEQLKAVIRNLHIPTPDDRAALGTAQVARTPADPPIVNASVYVMMDDGHVRNAVAAIGGASKLPAIKLGLSTLAGNPLDEPNIASAVKMVAPTVDPVADYRGSVAYRREMARVCVQRALLDCMAQLKK